MSSAANFYQAIVGFILVLGQPAGPDAESRHALF